MYTNGPARGRDVGPCRRSRRYRDSSSSGRLSLHRFQAIVDRRCETRVTVFLATIGFGSLGQGIFRLRVNHQRVITKYCNA
jgi:hypothetical protein